MTDPKIASPPVEPRARHATKRALQRLEMEAETPAAVALCDVQLTLLAAIEANEDGVRRALAPEPLHDFRVAVRRTRSALGQLKGVFAAPAVEHFQDELRWLGGVTGTARDLDVYLQKLDGYGAALPAEVRADLEPLRDFLAGRRRGEQARLIAALDSARYRRLLHDWRVFLTSGALPSGLEPPAEPPPDAARPIAELAAERIWRAYRRVRKRGRRLDLESPDGAFHDLRIAAKKLRYLMEFFRSLFPPAEIESLIKVLKRLQDVLGDFNDYAVQRQQLERFEAEMSGRGLAPAATLLAMGRLRTVLEQGQLKQRRRFAQRFDLLAGEGSRERFRALFKRGLECGF